MSRPTRGDRYSTGSASAAGSGGPQRTLPTSATDRYSGPHHSGSPLDHRSLRDSRRPSYNTTGSSSRSREGLRYMMSGYQDTDFRPPSTQSSMKDLDASTASTPAASRLPLSDSREGSTQGLGVGAAGAGAGVGASGLGRNMSGRRGGSKADEGWTEPKAFVPTNPTKRRWLFFGVPIFLLLAAGLGVGLGVGLTRNKNKSSGDGGSSDGAHDGGSGSGDSSSDGGKGGDGPQQVKSTLVTGQSGSTITMEDGTNFTYNNNFGGSWAEDPANPYNASGKAQSWTPSLMEEWVWGRDTAKGVNLGGWLLTEPFIVPSLYEQWANATPKPIDEYTLCQAMGDQAADAMEEHYKTFITEEDFALIASAGLNWLRIPLGFWAIETQEGEPYVAKTSWTYFNKAIMWSRKYGLRILLDFHGLPGSQNGWNHSGKGGIVNWMFGVMGLANAQRSLEQLRSMTEYLSQPGIKEVVPMLGLVNEVQASVIQPANLQAFYYQAYQLIRGITGFGAGNGPIIAIHEGFMGVAPWAGFLNGADRLALDQHPYLAFPATQSDGSWDAHINQACNWGGATNNSRGSFGITIGGEWSLAPNDCGYWLDGVDSTPKYVSEGVGSCDQWERWMDYDQDMRDGLMGYCQAQMDALGDWFFWTWKIANSTVHGYPTSPTWHYRLGWEQGWIPKDPRGAQGYCAASADAGQVQFNGNFPGSATGAATTSWINPDQLASHSAWPPTSIGPNFDEDDISRFPTLTQTGAPVTLPLPSTTGSVTNTASPTLNGWEYPNDKNGAYAPVSGCSYPPEYDATAQSNLPDAACTGGGGGRRAISARITGAPRI